MKKYFKSICAALGALMAVSALTACGPIKRGGSTGDNGGDEIKPDDDGLAASITVHYYAGGFGNETNKLLSADFKALTGKTVKWEPSYTVGEIQQLLVNNQERFDIVMPLMNMYQAEDAKRLEDITSVYNSTYEGENKAIKDKMNQTLYEYIEAKDGKRYQMFTQNSVSAMCYNADTLDEAFGEGNWELPRTTTELFKMGDQLKAKRYYTVGLATGINYNWDYLGTVWWAQYDGLESFEHYWYGEYKDSASGEWKKGTEINDTDGRKYSLQTLSRLLSSKNGYSHSLASRMTFEEAQRAFLGGGFVDDKKKVAFMVNGDWLENEMSSYLLSHPQDIGMMRAPVVSEIIGKLATVNTDAKLSEVVKAVDEGKTSVEGVSAEDFETVRQARLMGYTATPNYPLGIPANRPESKKALAKKFLTYLYSDRAQKIIAKELKGLCYPCYTPDETVPVSDFVRTRLDAFGNDMIPIFPHNRSQMVYRGGLGDLVNANGPDAKLYNGTTAENLLATCKKGLQDNWQNYLDALK